MNHERRGCMYQVLNCDDKDTKRKKHQPTLMQIEFSTLKKIIFTFVIMSVLIAFVYFYNIPDPNMILIAGLVLCSAVFGYGGGITAGVIMLLYTLFFFSTEHSFIHFTEQNIQKVFVTIIGIVADLLLVCSLKREEIKAFKDVKFLTEKLQNENESLQIISMQDVLTGLQNRLALRRDYDSYKNRELTVMILDLDNFKMINDTYGHAEGDKVLKKTGELLAKTFGKDYCYRYGGDEFLVLCPDLSESEFTEKLNDMMKSKPSFNINEISVNVEFSFGYVHDLVRDIEDLRQFFSLADQRMYAAKNAKQ